MLQAVSRLEPRWEDELAGVEFGVEEIPAADLADDEPDPVPLARLEPGTARQAQPRAPGDRRGTGGPDEPRGPGGPDDPDGPEQARLARIVLYRRPLLARADGEEELAELVLDVVVEQFARLLGVDPELVDPGYPAGD